MATPRKAGPLQEAERAVLAVSEREQRRFAQDLHDGLGQQLAGIGLMTKALLHAVDAQQPELREDIQRLINQLTEAVKLTRHLARGMDPMGLDDGQFEPAVRSLAGDFAGKFNVACEVDLDPSFHPPKGEAATQLYRIVREAIENALKHGKPTRIAISLGAGEALLTVEDDGSGIRRRKPPAGSGGLGLQIMRYRAESLGARLTVMAGAGGGTSVRVSLPTVAAAAEKGSRRAR